MHSHCIKILQICLSYNFLILAQCITLALHCTYVVYSTLYGPAFLPLCPPDILRPPTVTVSSGITSLSNIHTMTMIDQGTWCRGLALTVDTRLIWAGHDASGAGWGNTRPGDHAQPRPGRGHRSLDTGTNIKQKWRCDFSVNEQRIQMCFPISICFAILRRPNIVTDKSTVIIIILNRKAVMER